MPCPAVEPVLHKLGEGLQLTGFANFTFIREKHSQQLYLLETDFRPNRWVRHGELVGVDWLKALRDPSGPLQRPQSTRAVRHFPDDLNNAIQTRQWDRVLYWMINRNKSWTFLPFREYKMFLGYVLFRMKRFARKMGTLINAWRSRQPFNMP